MSEDAKGQCHKKMSVKVQGQSTSSRIIIQKSTSNDIKFIQ